MKRFKVVLSILLILIMSIASPAFAATKQGVTYTRLGDSIAVGLGATNSIGYTCMFNAKLNQIYGKGVYNYGLDFAESGRTSGQLLDKIQLPTVAQGIAASDFITISIGANDLLNPFMEEFSSLIFTYYFDYSTGGIDFDQLMMDLAGWQANPYDPAYTHFNLFLAGLAVPFSAAVETFGKENWPAIIGGVRTINDNGGKYADIYVNTVYNPFVNIPILHDAIDPFIQGLNYAIEGYAGSVDYKVVDVYSAFEAYGNPKKLAVGDLSNLVQYLISQPTDPPIVPLPLHPTDLGYKFIFNMHKGLMD